MHVNPEYELISAVGPTNNRLFTSVVVINNKRYSEGHGCTKKYSEQIASKKTLEYFHIHRLFQC